MKQQNGTAETPTMVTVYAEKNESAEMQGVMVYRAAGLGWRFSSLTEMLKIHEHCLNCMGGPQHTHRLRAFYDDVKKEEIPPMDSKEMDNWMPEEPETFIIRVQYRQNASWQGSVQWVEGGKEEHFRSTLELIKLMDDALEKRDE